MYDGTDVYNTLLIVEVCGEAGSSVYVPYKMRSVHEGVLFPLNTIISVSNGMKSYGSLTCTDRLPLAYTYNCT